MTTTRVRMVVVELEGPHASRVAGELLEQWGRGRVESSANTPPRAVGQPRTNIRELDKGGTPGD